MSNGLAKAGKVASALDRLDRMEATMQTTVTSLVQGIRNMQEKDAEQVEIIEAIVTILGSEAVANKIRERREAADAADVAALEGRISAAVKEGSVTPTETIEGDVLVVGTERNSAGVKARPGLSAIPFLQLPEPAKTALAGKKVGDTVPVGDSGNTFAVVGIYIATPPKAPAEGA